MAAEIGLKDMIQQLRRELCEAITASAGEDLKFRLESIDLELQVAVTRSDEAGGGIKFWVVNAAASLGDQSKASHGDPSAKPLAEETVV